MNKAFSKALVLIPLFAGMCCLPIDGIAQADCKQQMQQMTQNSRNADSPIIVSMSELRANSEKYYGKTVAVDGEVHRLFTDNVFTIEGGDWPHDFDVLIISDVPRTQAAAPLESSVEPDKDVQVTGVVVPYDRGKLECAYGPLNLESSEGASFTKSPVLVVEKRTGIERDKPLAKPSHKMLDQNSK